MRHTITVERYVSSSSQLVTNIAALLCRPILYQHNLLILWPGVAKLPLVGPYITDPTGYEAFINHVHLDDITQQELTSDPSARAALHAFGMALIDVWSRHTRFLLSGDQAVLFYLGGNDTVSLRFHIQRTSHPHWLDSHNQQFLVQEQMEVYRTTATALVRL